MGNQTAHDAFVPRRRIRRPPIVAELKRFKPDSDWHCFFKFEFVASQFVPCNSESESFSRLKLQRVQLSSWDAASESLPVACCRVPAMAPTGLAAAEKDGGDRLNSTFSFYIPCTWESNDPILCIPSMVNKSFFFF